MKYIFEVPIKNLSVFNLCVSGFADRFFELTTNVGIDFALGAELKSEEKTEANIGIKITSEAKNAKFFYPVHSEAVASLMLANLTVQPLVARFKYVSELDETHVAGLDDNNVFDIDKTIEGGET